MGVSGEKTSQGCYKDSEGNVLDERSVREKGNLKSTDVKNTWSSVVKNPPPASNNVVFDYCPPPDGSKVVSPPVEVLKEGNEKFRNCIVGTFSRGALSFNTVAAFAHSEWDSRGLISIAQKDTHIFFLSSTLQLI